MIRRFPIPPDSGVKTVLARIIARFFQEDPTVLLYNHEWGIWPSCEDRNLFKRFRQALGETAELIDKPGHIFSGGDLDDATSLIGLVLYFVWGAWLVSSSGTTLVEISHDEVAQLLIADDVTVDEDWLTWLDQILEAQSGK